MNPRDIEVRFSYLRNMAKSPAHYLSALLTDVEETRSMRIGYTAHAMVLGGEYVVYDGERRGKAWTEFKEENSGKKIVTRSEYEQSSRIAGAVHANKLAVELLSGDHEKELRWEYLGRKCIGHLDVLGDNRVVDLKTSMCVEPGRFIHHATRLGYGAQLAWYADGAGVKEAYVIAVETTRPYPVTVMKLTNRALEAGRKLYRSWMERLLVCEESGVWPAYSESILDFDAIDDELELEFEETEK